jgi:hypothetical protein
VSESEPRIVTEMAESVKTVRLTYNELVNLTKMYEDNLQKTSQDDSKKGML